jgi:hypothetical protein
MLLCAMGAAQVGFAQPATSALVTYAGSAGLDRFTSVMQLSDGTVLVSGGAADLSWLPAGTATTQLATTGINNAQGTGRIGFLLHLSSDLATILRVAHFPAGGVEDISFIKTTSIPGAATGDLYISGVTRDSRANNGGYFIARLNNNFVSGAPTALLWARSIYATGDHQTRQPWDVGGDGKVVYTVGEPFGTGWAAVYRLRADGSDDVVPDWRYHFANRISDNAAVEGGWTPASARTDVVVRQSAIIFKAGGRCELRSWTAGDYQLVQADGNGGTRQGRWPLDLFYNAPCDPNAPSGSGPGYTGYSLGANPTQRIGGIAIDRRSNDIYIGFSIQSRLPGGNPDFEPAVIAYTSTGLQKWWSRLYTETAQNSPPDQYVDGMAIDYALNSAVVLARTHGNAPNSLWNGVNAFQNRFTGTNGNIHISWLGKLRLSDGVRLHSTYLAEYVEGSTNFGAAHPDPNIDGFPNPNAGWPDVNTTRCETGIQTDAAGAVYVTCTGRRTITTRAAYQKMPLPGQGVGTWNDFVRVYTPTFDTLIYSSLLTGVWNTTTGAGGGNTNLLSVAPTSNGILVVGLHNASSGVATGNHIAVTNVPTWGASAPANESAILARLPFSSTPPTPTPIPPTSTPTSATLNGTLALQGRVSGTTAVSGQVTVTFLIGTTPAGTLMTTLASDGTFSLSGMTPGVYTVRIKHAQYLAAAQSVTLTAGVNAVNFGTLRAGDANDDNRVTLVDFSLISGMFNRRAGDAGYDARADLNGDGAVTLVDFSLLAGNFNQVGA